ncbi:MAG: DUF4213 domain-containing protein, partial [Deltaproteobacteria bacterium]|nr:DUF4213 domain-containing protein [Deltaproteobacteria bacterium]
MAGNSGPFLLYGDRDEEKEKRHMKILDDLFLALNFDAAVKDIRQGVFHTGVLTRYCGLAATLPQ